MKSCELIAQKSSLTMFISPSLWSYRASNIFTLTQNTWLPFQLLNGFPSNSLASNIESMSWKTSHILHVSEFVLSYLRYSKQPLVFKLKICYLRGTMNIDSFYSKFSELYLIGYADVGYLWK